jgi:hypothetical protein
MRYGILAIIMVGAFLCESIGWQMPFLVIALLVSVMFFESLWLLFLAIGIGLILDALYFRSMGETSIFLVGVLGVVYLYNQRFNTRSIAFVGVVSVVVSGAYALFFGQPDIFFQMIGGGLLSCLLFFIFPFFAPDKKPLVF